MYLPQTANPHKFLKIRHSLFMSNNLTRGLVNETYLVS